MSSAALAINHLWNCVPSSGPAVNKLGQRGTPVLPPGDPRQFNPAGFGWPGLSIHRGCHAASSDAMSAKPGAASGSSLASSRYCTSVARRSLSSMTRTACAAHVSVETACL